MIKDLAIYGAGGFGREMALMVDLMNAKNNEWRMIGFFDDGRMVGETVDGLPVLGGLAEITAYDKPLAIVIALADSTVRRRVVENIKNENIYFPVMIHPTSLAGSPGNKFGRGTLVTGGCILTTGIVLEDFVIINGMCTVGHDVKVGEYTSVMPGCNISGAATLGKNCLIGTGAKILQNPSIGDYSKIGAGAVVTRDVPSGVVAKSVPARGRIQNITNVF